MARKSEIPGIKPIKKLFIANRGEISIRIQKTCEKLGIAFHVVASKEDQASLHVKRAGPERSTILSGSSAVAPYLDIAGLLQSAKEANCDAIHPGYGFLAENAEFAERCIAAALIWVGPRPESIKVLGSKSEAREAAIKIGVPLLPGSKGGLSDAELILKAATLNFPLIIKAVSGGGGRGMRIVHSEAELREQLVRARSEARKFFNDEDVYVERYLEKPRHIEVQLLGDKYGTVVHLGTRECSLQRRHQKILEEAPAPFLAPDLRANIENSAIKLLKLVGYESAATTEFLVSKDEFFFLEVNTRIQVEHPVTEAICGLDIVEEQIRIASGEELHLKQEDLIFSGHAIEFRINAEDPLNSFRPVTGALSQVSIPEAPWIRVDAAVDANSEVTPHFDSLIAKLIVKGGTRAEAISRSYDALWQIPDFGIRTTIPFFRWLLTREEFIKAPLNITYIDTKLTKEILEEIETCSVLDPCHKKVSGVGEYVEYRSLDLGTKKLLAEITHCKNGCFLFVVKDESGEVRTLKSNSLKDGLRYIESNG